VEPCREEIPHFVELQKQSIGNQGLQIIGVSMDDEPEPSANTTSVST